MYAVIFCLGVFRMTGEKERYPLLRVRTDRIEHNGRRLAADCAAHGVSESITDGGSPRTARRTA